jgi:hypothetical protein
MPEPKRRRWLQLHLSTCIVLMFVAGGLLWANTRPASIAPDICMGPGPFPQCAYGWPVTAVELHGSRMLRVKLPPVLVKLEYHWDGTGVAIDSVSAAGILLVVVTLSEVLLRRRERQQP